MVSSLQWFSHFCQNTANIPDGLLNYFRGAALCRRPLMVRAALLRRSCDAATESLLRRCCDGAAKVVNLLGS